MWTVHTDSVVCTRTARTSVETQSKAGDSPPSQPNWHRKKERHILAVSVSGFMDIKRAKQKYKALSHLAKLIVE
jgi:hypothetical protein